MLVEQYGDSITELQVMSHAQYPAVFKEYMDHRVKYGDVSMLDTRTFLTGIAVGKEVKIHLEHGKELFTKVRTSVVCLQGGDCHDVRLLVLPIAPSVSCSCVDALQHTQQQPLAVSHRLPLQYERAV